MKPDYIQHDNEGQSLLSNQNEESNLINENVLRLYKKPQIGDVLISQLAESKREDIVLRQFELKQKIKTMRLLNN